MGSRQQLPRLRGYGTGPHDGKAIHRTRDQALEALATLLDHPSVREADKLHIYPCGSHWHVGRSTHPVGHRERQRLDVELEAARARLRAGDLNARIRQALRR